MQERPLHLNDISIEHLAYCSYCDTIVNVLLGSYCPQCGHLHNKLPKNENKTDNAEVAEAICKLRSL